MLVPVLTILAAALLASYIMVESLIFRSMIALIVRLMSVDCLLIALTASFALLASSITKSNSTRGRSVVSQSLKAVLIAEPAKYSSATACTCAFCPQQYLQGQTCTEV